MTDEILPSLNLRLDQHKPLVQCLADFPYLADIFANIYRGVDALKNLDHCGTKALELLTCDFFLPLLEKHGAIEKDSGRASGYRPLVSQISGENMETKYVMQSAKNGVARIAEQVDENTRPEDVLAAMVRTSLSVEQGRAIINSLRQQALEVLASPTSRDSNAKTLQLAIVCKLDQEEEKK